MCLAWIRFVGNTLTRHIYTYIYIYIHTYTYNIYIHTSLLGLLATLSLACVRRRPLPVPPFKFFTAYFPRDPSPSFCIPPPPPSLCESSSVAVCALLSQHSCIVLFYFLFFFCIPLPGPCGGL